MTRLRGAHRPAAHDRRRAARRSGSGIEDLGFGWISIWDHFYGATGQPDDAACLEAVAMHAALACDDVDGCACGSLVYSLGYRHPAVLANAITAIDHLSGGRADMGIGAGWAEVEYDAYGIPFPSIGDAHGPARGGHPVPARPAPRRGHRLRRARGSAHRRPQRAAAGAGQAADLGRRRRREAHAAIAAQYADGWNVPFVAPETFAAKRDVLHRHCADVGRDPAEIRCAVNVGLAWTEESLAAAVRRARRARRAPAC